MAGYDHQAIEAKWQARWEAEGTFRATEDPTKPKYYALCMFPYPSGSGLHVGHPESYTAIDIVARYKRMKGFSVLNPIGFDSFGLPAERAAHARRPPPRRAITRERIAYFRTQLQRLGFSFDWSREVSAPASPDYYHWTQWIFLKLHEQRPRLPRGSAGELVSGAGHGARQRRSGRRPLRGDGRPRRASQHAAVDAEDHRLRPAPARRPRRPRLARGRARDAASVDRPQQKAPRSASQVQGLEAEGEAGSFVVYTTRPDTLFGATYCVLAPEHDLVSQHHHGRAAPPQVEAYVEAGQEPLRHGPPGGRREEKRPVSSPARYAINPVNGQPDARSGWPTTCSITYGTGAIMAVPAHDDPRPRLRQEVRPRDHSGLSGAPDGARRARKRPGPATARPSTPAHFDGMRVAEFKAAIIDWLEAKGLGESARSTSSSATGCSRASATGASPSPWRTSKTAARGPGARLRVPARSSCPQVDAYKPDRRRASPPLARASDDWLHTTVSTASPALRETNTMPQWAGSCWYYLRYMDPHNDRRCPSANESA